MKLQKQNFLLLSTIVHLSALFICLICNYCINRQLTWSLIVALSLAESWCMIWAALTASKKAVKKILLIFSVTAIPYLAVLSVLLHLPIVLSLGSCIAILSLAAMWGIYGLRVKYPKRIFRVIGVSFLISIPLSLGIIYLTKYFVNIAYNDFNSDVFHTVISLILAGISFLLDKIFSQKQS